VKKDIACPSVSQKGHPPVGTCSLHVPETHSTLLHHQPLTGGQRWCMLPLVESPLSIASCSQSSTCAASRRSARREHAPRPWADENAGVWVSRGVSEIKNSYGICSPLFSKKPHISRRSSWKRRAIRSGSRNRHENTFSSGHHGPVKSGVVVHVGRWSRGDRFRDTATKLLFSSIGTSGPCFDAAIIPARR
jgi:hypothetical protein